MYVRSTKSWMRRPKMLVVVGIPQDNLASAFSMILEADAALDMDAYVNQMVVVGAYGNCQA